MSPRLPQLNAKRIIAAIKKGGFEESHHRGSHFYFYNPIKKLTTTVPVHPGDIKRPILKKLLSKQD